MLMVERQLERGKKGLGVEEMASTDHLTLLRILGVLIGAGFDNLCTNDSPPLDPFGS